MLALLAAVLATAGPATADVGGDHAWKADGLRQYPDLGSVGPSAPILPPGQPVAPASQDYHLTLDYVCLNIDLPNCQLMDEYFKGVYQRSNGRINFRNRTSYYELGIRGSDMFRLINDGTVEFGEFYPGYVIDEFPIFDVTNIWGLVDSTEQHLNIVEAVREDLDRVVTRESGGQVIFRNFYPSQYLYSRRPLRTPEDFEGMKIHVHSPTLGDFISALGADDQTMDLGGVYHALERGNLDAGVTGAWTAHMLRWHEVTDYLTGPFTGSIYQSFGTINGDTWAEMPEDLRQIMLEEGRKHEKRNLEAVFARDAEYVKDNIRQGTTHSQFSPEMARIFKAAAINEVLPKWIERAGGPASEAGRLFNERIAPISGVVVNPDGTATTARPASNAPRYQQVSAGQHHTCGVLTGGEVACWGNDYYGQATPPGGAFQQVSTGGFHTCGVKIGGTVTCWGGDEYGQVTSPSGAFVQVSAGRWHTCGVKTDGTVACWGSNYSGQATPPGGTFAQVSAGQDHTCGVKTDGTVACWSSNYSSHATPPGGTFAQVSSGLRDACGVKTDGTVVCWSSSYSIQATLPGGTFVQVAVGRHHSCGVKTDGTVACRGPDGSFGEATPPDGTFQQVSASGGLHTCGVKTDGTLACWGLDTDGQATPPGGTFQQVSAGLGLHLWGEDRRHGGLLGL